MFAYQFPASQGLQDPLAALDPRAHLVPLGPQENASRAFLGLMESQECQGLGFLDHLGLRETAVYQEQKDHLVVLEKQESRGFLASQVSQEPRENQD